MKPIAPIETSADLKAEIKRLNARCKELENQLDDSIDSLRDNYKTMAFNSIIGNQLKSTPIWATVAGFIAGSPKTQEMVSGLLEKLLSSGSHYFEKLWHRFFPGK